MRLKKILGKGSRGRAGRRVEDDKRKVRKNVEVKKEAATRVPHQAHHMKPHGFKK